ncbi:TetR/AcrR family transcriptional regulator [Tsukamurella soli]|uniref:HTH tetR-type domain-containing protein n=1 Tax=Tsukamurella soli TaxID=644556 RepID=A0ABP8K757_9ACTN
MRTDSDDVPNPRRNGAQTRREVQRVALDLFTAQGYEATSLREIAAALGINKASLYYHFPNKEAILRSLTAERGSEVADLLEWLHGQPPAPELLEEAVLRWVESFSPEKLRGIRFLAANPLITTKLYGGEEIGAGLSRFADELANLLPEKSERGTLLLRMSILSINAAVYAAAGTDISDAGIVDAALAGARVLIREATAGRQPSSGSKSGP